MINLLPHHRLHIPNSLAMFAAILLLVSSVVGFKSNPEMYSSSPEINPAPKVENVESNSINDAASNKRRGIHLGLLLFRRG